MIRVKDVSVSFGSRTLFENVNLSFDEGNRYGLIGANGSGKSTFMKILVGDVEPSTGTVTIAPGLRVGVLRQDHYQYDDCRVLDTVMMGYPELWEVMQERERLYARPEMTEEEGMRVGELESAFAEMDGYSAEYFAAELLEGLGIPVERHGDLMSSMIGGFKLRVLLAQVLFGRPDILLLDEPTNHLDLDTIRWLEHFLLDHKGTMVIISHDRHFLNTVCTHMVDVDYQQIAMFSGNYDYFVAASTLAREQRLAENARNQAKIAELREFVARFSANKSKAKQATSRQKQIEKIEIEEIRPSSRVSPYIKFTAKQPLGKQVVALEGVHKSFGDLQVLRDVNLEIGRGEKAAVIGPNGIGKTTLLNVLMGELAPDAGSVTWGQSAQPTYFTQDHHETIQKDTTVFEWLQRFDREVDQQTLRSILGRMLFSKDEVHKSTSVLSGGETARLMLGKMLLLQGNVLVLDEPTNHLDLESIDALSNALAAFEGTVIFVSHARQLVSDVANRIIELTPAGILDFKGTYDEFLAKREALASA
ncbi:ABC-F family ATPase [Alicyclobacillus cycloheptanicus]|uniref:ATPase subunit of ABC transporter with duplicated ATPase domains n=1 Tax=Alicyclobacillus cycloheptanicus TaxID=1457 RepID=A0ABT9XHR4_9BACL|nr:ABC-F family ATPase [Alicyclobacillus cycloheptanicus]MDQ0189737.1 ATPase subunit of ABC transporter with duplicated ATPase domains [Alicyclobacillus cycloheptanicus]WDM01947.1 ABC-F family ATPase [Alicyclobacillus cycloheptanicus]